MSASIRIGDIEITALNDGTSRLPAMFYPGLDVGIHPEVLDEDGTVHIPAGCFLIRTPSRTILVDAGIGPVTWSTRRGCHGPGRLPVSRNRSWPWAACFPRRSCRRGEAG